MSRVRLKVCGLTKYNNATDIIHAGADALGFVFTEKSKRNVLDKNLDWLARLPAFVDLVALFLEPDAALVKTVCQQYPSISTLQFHGNESESFCQQFGYRYLKAVPMKKLTTVKDQVDYLNIYPSASGFILDCFDDQHTGGSGQRFSWESLPDLLALAKQNQQSISIAGGISVNNIEALLDACAPMLPYAIDVSSGVEVSPGIKDKNLVQTITTLLNKG